MSRISYSEDEDYPGQFGLWQGNCARSLKGKSGQASLRELESALLALPDKRLVAGEFDDGKNVCAIGALARHKQIVPKADPECEMEEVGVECGMPRLVAWKVVEENDLQFAARWDGERIVPLTPEERYAKMLEWVQRQLASGQERP